MEEVCQWVATDIRHSIVSSLSCAGVHTRSTCNFFSRSIWQEFWVDFKYGMIAVKPRSAAVLKSVVYDFDGVLPTDKEIARTSSENGFIVYRWPPICKIGFISEGKWKELCPHALPIVE